LSNLQLTLASFFSPFLYNEEFKECKSGDAEATASWHLVILQFMAWVWQSDHLNPFHE
jgi:hypothetical protein